MGRVLVGFLVLVGLVALVGVGGYFVLRRADIPYAALASRYESAASRYIDLPSGVRMHYRDEGAADGAPTLVLVHGFAASLHTWEPWVARLGEQYRVISIDLPGHGLTRAPAGYRASIPAFTESLDEFARAYGLDHFALAGNSMGGNVSWEYALAHPERVDALILVDSSGWPESAANAREPIIFPLLRNPISAALLRDIDNTQMIRQGLETAFVDQTFVTDAMTARYADLSRAPGHRDVLLQMMLEFRDRNHATAERLAPLRMPVLILQGAQDNLIAAEHAHSFKDAIPQSELVIFENAGHVPQEEVADDSALAVREFLYQVYEGSAPPDVAAQ